MQHHSFITIKEAQLTIECNVMHAKAQVTSTIYIRHKQWRRRLRPQSRLYLRPSNNLWQVVNWSCCMGMKHFSCLKRTKMQHSHLNFSGVLSPDPKLGWGHSLQHHPVLSDPNVLHYAIINSCCGTIFKNVHNTQECTGFHMWTAQI